MSGCIPARFRVGSPDGVEKVEDVCEARRRFAQEAQIAIGLRHPNLVSVYDIGEDPETGLCYIVFPMDLTGRFCYNSVMRKKSAVSMFPVSAVLASSRRRVSMTIVLPSPVRK